MAGNGAPQVEAIEAFTRLMGPQLGPSNIVTSRRKAIPYFAAMVNAAASHVVEQDDVHNGSVFHPATVIFPPVLAVAEAEGKSGREILTAFEHHALTDPKVAAFRNKVRMALDAEVDTLYPKRWVGKLTATSTLGRALEARVDEPKGDPGNTLTLAEIEAKAIRLAQFRDGARADEIGAMVTWVMRMENDKEASLFQW